VNEVRAARREKPLDVPQRAGSQLGATIENPRVHNLAKMPPVADDVMPDTGAVVKQIALVLVKWMPSRWTFVKNLG
jgi:hypothetical protein